jgi:hypothetical protein
MKKGNSILLIIALLITCIIPILFVMPVSAAPSTIDGIGWSDATLEVEIGDSIAAKVWGNANEFSGYTMYNMTFRWDPNVVNISQITNGDSVAWGTFINGTINNESGWVKQIEGQVSGGGTVSGNYTLFNITFDGIIVGTTNITFVDTLGQDGCILYDNAANPIDGDYRNATIRVYPAEPVTFTATRYNYTDINLTFTPGAGGNTTVIR